MGHYFLDIQYIYPQEIASLYIQGIWTNLHHIACEMCLAKVVHSQVIGF